MNGKKYHENSKHKNAGVAVSISDEVNFMIKSATRCGKGQVLMISINSTGRYYNDKVMWA